LTNPWPSVVPSSTLFRFSKSSRALQRGVTGRDLLTGKDLEDWQRAVSLGLAAASAVGEFMEGAAAVKAGVTASAEVASDLAAEARAANLARTAAITANDAAAASARTLEYLDAVEKAQMALDEAARAVTEGALKGANTRVAPFAGGLGGSAAMAFSFLDLAFRALVGALVGSRRGSGWPVSECSRTAA
jgi:Pre-toxin TG